MDNGRDIAVVLSGGAVNGILMELGFLQRLRASALWPRVGWIFGTSAGALAGIVSGSGPTCAFLCADEDSAIDVATELAGVGVCRTVRVAHGPVPGARVVEQHAPPAPSGPDVSAVEKTMAMAPARRPDAPADADRPADDQEKATDAPDEPAEPDRDPVTNAR